MAINKQVLLGFLILSVLISSCSSTSSLYKDFTRRKASLEYIYDSNVDPEKYPLVVAVDKPIITDRKFTMPGVVRKIKGKAIPLIVYTEWGAEFEYSIGSAAIAEDPAEFIQSAFIEESKRSGTYKADTALSQGDLVLEIEVDSIGAKGPYVQKGYFLFVLMAYSYGFSEYAGPGIAYSKFHYVLRKGDEILIDDYTSNRAIIQPLQHQQNTVTLFRNNYTTNLVESLSMTFKANIETIVEDINILLFEEIKGKVENDRVDK